MDTKTLVLPDEDAPTQVMSELPQSGELESDGKTPDRGLQCAVPFSPRLSVVLLGVATTVSLALSTASILQSRRAHQELSTVRALLERTESRLDGDAPSALAPSDESLPPDRRTPTSTSVGSLRVLEHRASTLAASRRYVEALGLYRELSARVPTSQTFRDFTAVLRHKAGCSRAAEGSTPSCR